jgi:Flp pilus assembly protein TadD
VYALAPGALADLTPVVELAEKGVQSADNYEGLLVLGAVLHRAGRSEAAVVKLREAVKVHPEGGTTHSWLFLALALQRQGQGEEARTWLDRAVRQLDTDAGGTRKGTWVERQELALLRKEAVLRGP